MYQISFYVPTEHAQVVKNVMFDAGAGQFDNYEQCAWQTVGTGQFKPVNNTNPAIGKRPFKFQVQLFTPKKEQDAVGIIYSFLGLVKRSTNEPIQTSYSRAKIPYLSMFKTGNDAVIHC